MRSRILSVLFVHLFVAQLAFIFSGGPASAQAIDPLPALRRMARSSDPIVQWKAGSLIVQIHRSRGEYEALNKYLRTNLFSDPNRKTRARARLWIAGNHYLQKKFAQAESELNDLIRKFGKVSLRGRSVGRLAREKLADVHTAAGNKAKAIGALRALIRSHSREIPPALTRMRLARLHAEMGQAEKSTQLLREIIKKYPKEPSPVGQGTVAESAERQLRLSRQKRTWMAKEPTALIKRLSAALKKRDVEALAALASPNQFVFGMLGSHVRLRPFKEVAPILKAALAESGPVLSVPNDAKDEKKKLYVFTTGWKNPFLSEQLFFYLTRNTFGWEWRGILLTAPQPEPPQWREARRTFPPGKLKRTVRRHQPEFQPVGYPPRKQEELDITLAQATPPTGLPLRFTLRAPWAAGGAMASGWFALPILGTACDTIGGAMGSYYGQNFHTGTANFAIDFTQWGTAGIFPFPMAGQTVASVAFGEVISTVATNGQVTVRHETASGVTDGYQSLYAHMNPVIVSTGMFVARGSPLGAVDDIGMSTGHHLHFSLQDGGASVMPTPLEGFARDTRDFNALCITSTNSNLFVDSDSDGRPNAIDNCPLVANSNQSDWNGNGIGDRCDDSDGDGVADFTDNCRNTANPTQADMDGDGTGDVCDPDRDGDGVAATDNCPDVWNPGQADLDRDLVGDRCDADIDQDGLANNIDFCPWTPDSTNADADYDQVGNVCDNCSAVYNPDQKDANLDGEGDLCDSDDSDGDGLADNVDPCPANPDLKCPAIFGPVVTESEKPRIPEHAAIEEFKEFERAEFIFESMKKKFGFPIGPGPVCLTCPPFSALRVEVVMRGLPQGVRVSVQDSEERIIPAVESAMLGGKRKFVFSLPQRQTYNLLFSPKAGVDLQKRHQVELNVKYKTDAFEFTK